MVTNEVQKQLLGCSDTACLIEIAGALDTDFLAIASVGQIGDRHLLNIKTLDVRRGKVLGRTTEQVSGGVGELTDAVQRGVAAVVAMDPVNAPLSAAGNTAAIKRDAQAASVGEQARGDGSAAAAMTVTTATEADTSTGSLLPWIGLVASGAAGVVGALLLATARSEQSITTGEYSAYVNAEAAGNGDAAYADVEAAVGGRNVSGRYYPPSQN